MPIEECLRLESPNQLGNRLVSEPVTIGGVALEAGTYLTLCIGAANRDPEEFAQPDLFAITRKPNRHLAFAAGALTRASAWAWRALRRTVSVLARFCKNCPGCVCAGEGQRGARARVFGDLFPAGGNRLNGHRALGPCHGKWWARSDSNRGPRDSLKPRRFRREWTISSPQRGAGRSSLSLSATQSAQVVSAPSGGVPPAWLRIAIGAIAIRFP